MAATKKKVRKPIKRDEIHAGLKIIGASLNAIAEQLDAVDKGQTEFLKYYQQIFERQEKQIERIVKLFAVLVDKVKASDDVRARLAELEKTVYGTTESRPSVLPGHEDIFEKARARLANKFMGVT